MLFKQFIPFVTLLSCQWVSAQIPAVAVEGVPVEVPAVPIEVGINDCNVCTVDEFIKISDYLKRCKLTDAKRFYLRGSHITSIPSEVAKMSSLAVMEISNTAMTRLVFDFGELKNSLTQLSFYQNERLRGPLPRSIFQLKKLQQLDIVGTPFGGNLPADIGQLVQLERIDIRKTDFTGNIPDMFDKLTKLGSIDLNGNKLYGQLPPSFNKILPNLSELALSNNNFEGLLSTRFTSITRLDVSNSNLTGVVPLSVRECQASNSKVYREIKALTADPCGNLPLSPISRTCQSDLKESQQNYMTECGFKVAPKTVINNANAIIFKDTVFQQVINKTDFSISETIIKKSPEIRPALDSIFKPLCTQPQCSKSLSKRGLVSRVTKDCSANPSLVSMFKNTVKLVEARSASVLCHMSPSSKYTCATEFLNTVLTQYPRPASATSADFCTPCFLKVAANLQDMEFVMRSFGYDAYFGSLDGIQATFIKYLVQFGRNFDPIAKCPDQALVNRYYVKQSL